MLDIESSCYTMLKQKNIATQPPEAYQNQVFVSFVTFKSFVRNRIVS